MRIAFLMVIAGVFAFTPAMACGTSGPSRASSSDRPAIERVSRDAFIGHVEPALAVDPTNPHHLLAASQVVPPDDPAGDRRQLATYVSFDGGRSWRSNGALPGSSAQQLGLDVSVAFDRHGIGYVLGEEQHSVNDAVAPLYLWRALSGGRVFSSPVLVASGEDCCDHASVAVDQTDGARTGTLYVVYTTRTGILVRVSSDAGHEWSSPAALPEPDGLQSGGRAHPIGPTAVVDPDGTLHVAYIATSGRIVVASSSDGARSFSASVVSDVTGGLPALASGPAGSLFVTFLVQSGAGDAGVVATKPASSTSAGGARPMVAVGVSRDSGASWGRLVHITAPSPDATLSQPAIATGPHGGLYVSFFSTETMTDVYIATSHHGLSFGAPQRVTPSGFNPMKGLPTGKNGPFIGDYQALATSGTTVHPFWNDTRTGRLELFTARWPAS
jgi:hypothetical protein